MEILGRGPEGHQGDFHQEGWEDRRLVAGIQT